MDFIPVTAAYRALSKPRLIYSLTVMCQSDYIKVQALPDISDLASPGRPVKKRLGIYAHWIYQCLYKIHGGTGGK